MKRSIARLLDLFRLVVWLACAVATVYLIVFRLFAGDFVGFVVGIIVVVVAYVALMFVYAALRAPFTTDAEHWEVKAENDRILGRR